MNKIKEQLQEVFELVEEYKYPNDCYSYKEQDGMIFMYNKAGHLVMFMSKQDWLDICKWKGE